MVSSHINLDSYALPPLVIEPKAGEVDAEYCVIWLHGLGANGHDFESIVPELNLDLPIRYVFPHAPSIPVSVNMGMRMPAWYDIKDLGSIDQQVDWKGIQRSEAYVVALIEEAVQAGFETNRILLAGFSQGGVIATRAALKFSRPLAGVMALSTYFPVQPEETWQQRADFPILIAHGEQDPVVPYRAAQDALNKLSRAKFSPRFLSYPMAHQVCQEEIEDMSKFIKQMFGE